jgi:hypothetical protein
MPHYGTLRAMGDLVTLRQEVEQRLRQQESCCLSEADVQVHITDFHLTRPSGNEVARFLALGRLVASVEMFVDQETDTLLSIQLLVARDEAAHARGWGRLHQEFTERINQPIDSQINIKSP